MLITYKLGVHHGKRKNNWQKTPVCSAIRGTNETFVKTPSRKHELLSQKRSPMPFYPRRSVSLHRFEKDVVELTNMERKRYGLHPLQIDPRLVKVARMKSIDMRKKNYFSHTSPTYGSPFTMIADHRISFSVAAENIAVGHVSPEQVVKGWMNSPGHRRNILNQMITHIGVGFERAGNHWTQLFIRK